MKQLTQLADCILATLHTVPHAAQWEYLFHSDDQMSYKYVKQTELASFQEARHHKMPVITAKRFTSGNR